MVDRFFHVFFGAGCVTLFFAPTIGAAGAKPREADDFSRCGEARQMSGHGAAGGMAEGKDFAAGKMLVGQQARALKYGVESALEIAVENFLP